MEALSPMMVSQTNKLPRWLLLLTLLLLAAFLAACGGAATPSPGSQEEGASAPAVAETEPVKASPAQTAPVQTATAAESPATPAVEEPTSTQAPSQEAGEEQATLDGIPVGFTPEGYPYRGDPNAPVTVYEYSDYQCPFCSRHVSQTAPALDKNFVRKGTVRFVFRDMPLDSLHPNATPAAIAAACVADQGPVAYWKMHDLLFETQPEWSELPDPTDFFAQLAQQAGADLDQYQACLDSGEKQVQVAASLEEAQSLGFSGTPSFRFVREADGAGFNLVGAQPYDVFDQWISALQAGEDPVDPQQAREQEEPQLPFWATAEGLQPDPDRPGYTLAGDEFRGDPEATLTVVEFSDFECPFCRKHTLETQPILDQEFVEPGTVRWVFKHFPLDNIHPRAAIAGVAAECAAEQGQFWEMHDKLFTSTDRWVNDQPEEGLKALAQDLGLDMDAFNACLEDPAMMDRVRSDQADGAPFVRGTPTFVVLFPNGDGRLIPGALPADQFSQALTQLLEQAEAAN